MPRVVHFEICAGDPQKSADFYRHVFGWEMAKWGGPVDYWLATTGDNAQPGINGAIMHQNELLKGRSTPSTFRTSMLSSRKSSRTGTSWWGRRCLYLG